jgi:hypothetical protein
MSNVRTTLQIWHPELPEDRDAVLRELEEVLKSPHFSNSKRYPALLRHVVRRTLEGQADLLKERTVGVEVFDRTPNYDTNSDTIVRYTAGEVRKRLAVYYHEQERLHSRPTRIQITLPVGSYVPEFLYLADEEDVKTSATPWSRSSFELKQKSVSPVPSSVPVHLEVAAVPETVAVSPASVERKLSPWSRFRPRWGTAALILLVVSGLLGYRLLHPQTAVGAFWAPLLRAPGTTLICTGGVVFAHNKFSGVTTASKDVDYPFVSMQIANSMNQIGWLLERGGTNYEMSSAPSTSLNEMRDRPLVLVGAYNNPWTLRLLTPLRYYFPPEPAESILDRQNPQAYWKRDRSVTYSNSDDFALVARFHASTTGGIVVALAGLGRNGTEAATQFATSPQYMQMLRDRIGKDINSKNIEVVLKIRVIEGKTGAPSIEAVYVW